MTALAHPPGPGAWEIDLTHFPRPPSPICRDLYTRVFPEGLAAGMAEMGLLLETLQLRVSATGHVYTQPKLVAAPAGAPPPPGFVLWLLSRLHPSLRARNRRVQEVLETKAWRADARRFQEVDRPELILRHRALLAEDVGQMSDTELLAHVERCHAAFERAVWIHGRYTAATQFPMGDLIAHARAWADIPAAEVMRLVAGHAPTSAGCSPELDALIAALRAHPSAWHDDEEADPGAQIAALLAAPEPVGGAARAWFEVVGHRVVAAYDVAEPTAAEFPFLLVAALRAGLAGRLGRAEAAGHDEAVLRRIPEAHRGAFDALLAEARAISHLRDERCLYADYWAAGILRRALLEAGRRLAARGAVPTADHLCFATLEEVRGLMTGGEPLPANTLEDRARQRGDTASAPPALFGVLHPPPSPDLFPAPTARALRALFAVLDAMFQDCAEATASGAVTGFPVSTGTYEGIARVVNGPEDFHRIRPGDVLVATMTSPVYNVILPLLGALVTDRGGALSHAAIVSREFGIPGVVGCRDATRRLRDGARVRVDGSTGRVTLAAA